MSNYHPIFEDIDGAAGPGPLVSNSDLMESRLLESQRPFSPFQQEAGISQTIQHSENLNYDLGGGNPASVRQLPEFLLPSSQDHRRGQDVVTSFETVMEAQPRPALITEEQSFYDSLSESFKNLQNGPITETQDVDISAAVTVFGFNIIIFSILIAAYEILSKCFPSVYANKKQNKDRYGSLVPNSVVPLGWMPSVFRVGWNQVLKAGGLDAYFFLRFLRMCAQMTAVSGFWGMIILWPVYFTGGGGANGWYYISMSNVQQGSWRTWFPAIFMWLTSYYVYFLMNEEYKHYLELRMDYLSKGDLNTDKQSQHSIIVEEIPYELRSDKNLYAYFDALFPGKVHSAHVALNIPDLERESNKRQRILRRLEKSLAYYEVTGKKPTHVVGRKRVRCCGVETAPIYSLGGKTFTRSLSDDDSQNGSNPEKGQRVDSISYYTDQLEMINNKVKNLQAEKKALAYSGDSSIRASEWISHMLGLAGDAAATALNRDKKSQDGLILGFNKSRRSQTFLGMLGIDFVVGGFSYLHRNIDVVADAVTRSATCSTGFVTFKDLATVTCATTAPICHDPEMMIASVAPDTKDILWENVHISLTWANGRELTANLFLSLGAILWSVPVASIQAIANINSLSQIPGLDWLKSIQSERFSSFINSYLPVVLLLLIIVILPFIFEWVSVHYELRKTKSNIQTSILGRYFYYQLANIYVTATAGSLLDSLANILNHPGNVFELLGKSFPSVVGYFITLLITRTLVGLPCIMLRFGSLCRVLFLKFFFKEKYLSQRELDEVNRSEMLFYGWEYPMQLLVIVICFTYACISPVILPFGALYFFGALIVYKKQILVVYAPDYESGGTMFPAVCHRTLIGLICGQITLIGYVIIRAGFYQPIILLPLPFLTLRMMRRFQRLYSDTGLRLSLERGLHLDQEDMEETKDFSEDMYRQPVLGEGLAEPQPYRRTMKKNITFNTPSTIKTRLEDMDTGTIFERRRHHLEKTASATSQESDKIV